jgi:hypothetical protein
MSRTTAGSCAAARDTLDSIVALAGERLPSGKITAT